MKDEVAIKSRMSLEICRKALVLYLKETNSMKDEMRAIRVYNQIHRVLYGETGGDKTSQTNKRSDKEASSSRQSPSKICKTNTK